MLPITQTVTFTSPAAPGTVAQAAVPFAHFAEDDFVIEAHLAGATGGTLDVYIQETWDVDYNGAVLSSAVWSDVAHFTQLAAAAPAVVYRVGAAHDSTIQAVGTGSTASPGVALAAGKFCGAPWGPMIRIVCVAGASTTAGASISIKFRQRRPGHE